MGVHGALNLECRQPEGQVLLNVHVQERTLNTPFLPVCQYNLSLQAMNLFKLAMSLAALEADGLASGVGSNGWLI
jgi:hypothetical protein